MLRIPHIHGAGEIEPGEFSYDIEGDNYYSPMPGTRHIIITKIDTPAHIVSGTFEAVLVNDSLKKVNISNGRFDCPIYMQN